MQLFQSHNNGQPSGRLLAGLRHMWAWVFLDDPSPPYRFPHVPHVPGSLGALLVRGQPPMWPVSYSATLQRQLLPVASWMDLGPRPMGPRAHRIEGPFGLGPMRPRDPRAQALGPRLAWLDGALPHTPSPQTLPISRLLPRPPFPGYGGPTGSESQSLPPITNY